MTDALTEAQTARAELHKSSYWPTANRVRGTNHLWRTDQHLAATIAALTISAAPSIAPPREPVTAFKDVAAMAVNLYLAPADLADFVIDGTGDSAVVVQAGAAGSTLQRFKITRAGALPGLGWARHGVYGKAARLTLEDFDVSVTPGPLIGQCFSLRKDHAILRRFRGAGAPHIVGYFEESDQPGDILVEDGEGSFTSDTAVWLDGSIPGRRFTFRNCHFTGNGAFVKKGPGFAGTVEIDSCTLNGQPV